MEMQQRKLSRDVQETYQYLEREETFPKVNT